MTAAEEIVRLAASAHRTRHGAGRVQTKHARLRHILQKRNVPTLEKMFPFQEGDKVIVTRGTVEDVGKVGVVRKVDYDSVRLLVEGAGLRTVRDEAGSVFERQRMIDMRHVRFVDPKTGAPTSFSWMYVTHPDGRTEEERIARSGAIIPKPTSPAEIAQPRGDRAKDTPLSVMQTELTTTDDAEIEKHVIGQLELLEKDHCEKLQAGWRKAQSQHQAKLQAWQQFKFEVYVRAIEILRKTPAASTLLLPPTFRTWTPIRSRPVPVSRKSTETVPDPEVPCPQLSPDASRYFESHDGPPPGSPTTTKKRAARRLSH